jgi:tetratricopeptide (TPR) repeat protein
LKLFKIPFIYGLTLVAAIAAAFVFWNSSKDEIKIPSWPTTQCYKQNPEIEKTLRRISSDQPQNFIAMNDLIQHLVSQAKRNQSDELVEEIFSLIANSKKIIPSIVDNKTPYMAEALMLSYQHRFQEASDKLLVLLKANGSDSSVLRALVWNALAKKNIETAYMYLPEISLKPDIEIYLLYAKLMFLKSNRDDFKFYIKKIFAVESDQTCFESLEARMLLARYAIEMANPSLARASLKSAAQINSDDPRLFLLNARLASDGGQHSEAIEVLEAGMKKQPLPKYLTEMAKVEILRGRTDAAQNYLDQSLLILEDSLKKNAGHRLELAEALTLKNTEASLRRAVELLTDELSLRASNEVYYWLSVARALQKDTIYGLKTLQPVLDQEFSTAMPALFKVLKDRQNVGHIFLNRSVSVPLPAEIVLLNTPKSL